MGNSQKLVKTRSLCIRAIDEISLPCYSVRCVYAHTDLSPPPFPSRSHKRVQISAFNHRVCVADKFDLGCIHVARDRHRCGRLGWPVRPFSRERSFEDKNKGRELSPVLSPCSSLVEKKKGLKKRIIRARRIALGDVASSFRARKLVAGRRRNSSNDGGKWIERS